MDDKSKVLVSRIIEYRKNPHHINPMSERFQELLSEVIDYFTQSEWKTIETVPKTGKKFCGYDCGPMVMLATKGESNIIIGFWNGRAFDDGDYNSYMTGFTHWQPLPEPPQ